MTLQELLDDGAPPIVAILRGLVVEDAAAIGHALVDVGVRIIEVPLNSPQPLRSIERLRQNLPASVLIGAGTVTSVEAVDAVQSVGGQLIVAPNTDAAVIRTAIERGLEIMPGVMTPSEAFAAAAAGAKHLKLFPASSGGVAHLRALLSVLPAACRIWAVGGTSDDNLGTWLEAGAAGVGIGGALYASGDTVAVVHARATRLVNAWRLAKQA